MPQSGQWQFSRRPGGWIVATSPSGHVRRLMVVESRGRLSFSLGGRLWRGDIASESRSGGVSSENDLTAQFPGKVRKVLVAAGAAVKAGDPLVLVEAMKMEFAVKAPHDGRIKKVLVQEGQQLSPGDHFVEFESANNG